MMKSINALSVFMLHANQGPPLKLSAACSVEIPYLGNMDVFQGEWESGYVIVPYTPPHSLHNIYLASQIGRRGWHKSPSDSG
jgi:hypothetical protein